MVGRGVLWHGTVEHTRAQALVRNMDMKYNHGHYSALHKQGIQECKRQSVTKTTQNMPQKVSKVIHVLCIVLHVAVTSSRHDIYVQTPIPMKLGRYVKRK